VAAGLSDPLLPFSCLKLADGAPQFICPAASSSATHHSPQLPSRPPLRTRGRERRPLHPPGTLEDRDEAWLPAFREGLSVSHQNWNLRGGARQGVTQPCSSPQRARLAIDSLFQRGSDDS
jgi:hypothetical protein